MNLKHLAHFAVDAATSRRTLGSSFGHSITRYTIYDRCVHYLTAQSLFVWYPNSRNGSKPACPQDPQKHDASTWTDQHRCSVLETLLGIFQSLGFQSASQGDDVPITAMCATYPICSMYGIFIYIWVLAIFPYMEHMGIRWHMMTYVYYLRVCAEHLHRRKTSVLGDLYKIIYTYNAGGIGGSVGR